MSNDTHGHNYALLSNDGKYTIFKFGGRTIRFRAPYSLERYTKVKKWENGYIVVMAKYAHSEKDEEEYIDLVPVLENLYISPQEFLKPINGLKIEYE